MFLLSLWCTRVKNFWHRVGIKTLNEAGDVIFLFPFYYQGTIFWILAEPRRNGFHGPSSSTASQQLPNQALELKNLGNTEYEGERYSNAIEIYNRALGAKYLNFFSSRSLKMREKCISFAQFVYFLRKVCLLFDIIVNFIIQNLKSKHISL